MNKKSIYLMKVVALITCALVIFSSCATIFTKGKYPLMINSEPDGATVIITDKKGNEVFSGNTPTTVTLKSSNGYFAKATYQVKITYPGYNDKVTTVSAKIKGAYFLNLLLGGAVGMLIVDPLSGHMWKLDTKYINVTLSPTGQTTYQPSLKIMDINQIPDDWKEHLVAID